jgi:hypothetical protein
MRIKIIQKPGTASVDGLDLTKFIVGRYYDLGQTLGALFLAEGWGVPADDAFNLGRPADPKAPNVVREIGPSYSDGPSAVAADRRRNRRSRSSRVTPPDHPSVRSSR